MVWPSKCIHQLALALFRDRVGLRCPRNAAGGRGERHAYGTALARQCSPAGLQGCAGGTLLVMALSAYSPALSTPLESNHLGLNTRFGC